MQKHHPRDLYSLPMPVLMGEIVSRLSPKDLSQLTQANKQYNKFFSDNTFWESKFKIHYPSLYEKYKKQQSDNWFQNFGKAYSAEREHLVKLYEENAASVMKFILAARENDLDSLKQINNLAEFLVTTIDDLTDLDIFVNRADQNYAAREYCWELISKYKKEADQDEKTEIKVLQWAIACHRPKEEVLGRFKLLRSKKSYDKSPDMFDWGRGTISLLQTALKYRNQDVINYILTDHHFSTPHFYHYITAINNEDMENLKLLLDKLPKRPTFPEYPRWDLIFQDRPPVLYAAIRRNRLDFVNLLVDKGFSIHGKEGHHPKTPLYIAIEENADPKIVSYLLVKDTANLADHEYENNHKKKFSLLYACAKNGGYELFKTVINKYYGSIENWKSTDISKHLIASLAVAAFKAERYDFLNKYLQDFKVHPAELRNTDPFHRILDSLCEKKKLTVDEKQIATTLVNNGFMPYSKNPLEVRDPELLQIIYKKEIGQLNDYITKREKNTRGEYFTLFSKKFGFSGKDKIAAAKGLLDILTGSADNLSHLTSRQWAAMHQGTLGNIYRSIRTSAHIEQETIAKIRPAK